MTSLTGTIRVHHRDDGSGFPHGAVETGVTVEHRGANVKNPNWRVVASTPRVVHARRFAPNRIPEGVDLSVAPATHPCGYGEGCPPPKEDARA